MNLTDWITLTFILLVAIRGAMNGFLRSTLGLLSLVIATVIAAIYYIFIQGLMMALAISILGPIVIHLLLSAIIKIKGTKDLSPLSRVLGVLFNTFWQGAIWALCMICIVYIPFQFPWVTSIQKNIKSSKTYVMINQSTGGKLPSEGFDLIKVTTAFQDPEKFKRIQKTSEYRILMDDPKVVELISDEEVAEQIQNKEIGKLLTNPKMQAIMKDKDLIAKFFALHKTLMAEDTKELSMDAKKDDAAIKKKPHKWEIVQ